MTSKNFQKTVWPRLPLKPKPAGEGGVLQEQSLPLSVYRQKFPEKRRKGMLKEIHLHEDSRSSNLVILETLEKYGVKTVDIFLPKRSVEGRL
ncbi:hypothetical protein PAMP_003898 [Pampus punctatissimus]